MRILGHLELSDQLVGYTISESCVIDRPNKRKNVQYPISEGHPWVKN